MADEDEAELRQLRHEKLEFQRRQAELEQLWEEASETIASQDEQIARLQVRKTNKKKKEKEKERKRTKKESDKVKDRINVNEYLGQRDVSGQQG